MLVIKKIKIAIIYGGISFESNISIKSAANIINNIDKKKFDIILIGINKYGSFHIEKFFNTDNIELYLNKILNKNNNILKIKFNKNINFYSNILKLNLIPDIFFPVTHGEFGEDGNIQAILNIFKIPFIGSNVKSSCLCINKDLTKNFLKINNIPIVPFLKFNKNDILKISYDVIKKKFGKNLFIKPSNQGSSIGITLIKSKKNFSKAISRAFYFSENIIIEPLINGKEIECAVLNNYGKIKISECCEIVTKNNFYSYEQKYKTKSNIIIPANINNNIKNLIKNYSLKIFNLFECKSMARIDFLVSKNKIFVNEINSIPGFTKNSVYQKLWEYEGIKFKNLISILINSVIINK